jgi:hypothetical protein
MTDFLTVSDRGTDGSLALCEGEVKFAVCDETLHMQISPSLTLPRTLGNSRDLRHRHPQPSENAA